MNLGERSTALLHELGLVANGEAVTVTPLKGGISSDIACVTTAGATYCVKFALERLKVADEWTAPIRRNAAEYGWLEYVRAIDPALVPGLLGRSEALGGFAMAFLDPAIYVNWKSELLAGSVDVSFAAAVGAALGRIHDRAAHDTAIPDRFANQEDFWALRLDPYLNFTASRHPDLAGPLNAMVNDLMRARISLVHGDVSPKNILKGPDGPVFLDAECAVESDPCFDVAFCLNHLLIKSLARIGSPDALGRSILALWSAYAAHVSWENPHDLDRRAAVLLPGLLLARIDGKSPVEYLEEPARVRIRHIAQGLIVDPPASIADLLVRAERDAGHP